MADEKNPDVADALLRRDVEELAREVAELKDGIRDLVTAWRTAASLVVFMKWLSGLAAALLVVSSAAKHIGKQFFAGP